MKIINRIKYDGPPDGSSWLVYKYPSEKFVLGSQLIVNQGQEALFFKGGEALDSFKAGTHTLITGNLPLLYKYVNFLFGEQTPFSAEVYFVNKTSRLDMGWGTAVPFDFEDPRYHIWLNVRAHGQYGITIKEARHFVTSIIGAVPNGTTADYIIISKYFNGLINTKIKSITAKFMNQKKISFLEITSYLDKLSKDYKNALTVEFDRFGVEIINFYVESIKPRDCDIEKMKKIREEVSSKKLMNNELSSDTYIKKPSSNRVNNKRTENYSDNKESEVKCPHCRSIIPQHMKFCGKCGKPIHIIICPDCAAENPDDMTYCGNCGKKIGGDMT